jgi:hypothetical protein
MAESVAVYAIDDALDPLLKLASDAVRLSANRCSAPFYTSSEPR